ncbi:uncharacterized protein LOC122507973 [Leptopilina heterotoma]|uniref:uncharacterized protein LOC122507973 n=1 Tax=Leptopilina heterotoma TaxID=63436 RepID=UPI001CA8BF90|nr:uncharacterized protein LOC122507973 [Leptopilina heterotoma]
MSTKIKAIPHKSCCVHTKKNIPKDLEIEDSPKSLSSSFSSAKSKKQILPFFPPALKCVKKKCINVIRIVHATYNHLQNRRRIAKKMAKQQRSMAAFKEGLSTFSFCSSDEDDEDEDEEDSFENFISSTHDSNNNLISTLPENLQLDKFLQLLKRMENKDHQISSRNSINPSTFNQSIHPVNKNAPKKYLKLISFPLDNIEKSEQFLIDNDKKIRRDFCVVKSSVTCKYPTKFNKVLLNHRSGCVVTDNFEREKNKETVDANPFPNFDICRGFQFVSITRESDKFCELKVNKPEMSLVTNYQRINLMRNLEPIVGEDQGEKKMKEPFLT